MSLTAALRTRRGVRCSRCQRLRCNCPRQLASPLDTTLGNFGGERVQTLSIRGLSTTLAVLPRKEPDLSLRYQVPRRPDRCGAGVMSRWALHQLVEVLDLDRGAHELLVWSERWFAEDLSGLVSLIQAAKANRRVGALPAFSSRDGAPPIEALRRAIDGLVLDDAARRIVRWAESWRPRDVNGLVSLVDAARSSGDIR